LVLALYRPTVQLATLLVGDYTVAQDIVRALAGAELYDPQGNHEVAKARQQAGVIRVDW
jgi:hypothetical protein